MLPRRVLEKAQTHLHAENAAHGVVDARQRNLPFFDQIDNHVDALRIVRIHHHVDAGVDAHGNGFPFIGSHMITRVKVVDIGPVGDGHAVPVELFFEPAREQRLVGVCRNAVDRCGIDHHVERSGLQAFLERTEKLLAEVVFRNVSGRTVLARGRNAVAHVVLQTHRDVLQVNVVGVFPLQRDRLNAGHFRLKIRIFTPTLPQTRPAYVPAQVHHGRENPGHLCGTGLVCHGLTHHARVGTIERGTQVDLLRIERTLGQVRCTMDHIEAVDAGDSQQLHRLVLDLFHHRSGMLPAVSGIVHHVEDRTDLVLANYLLEFGRIDGLVGIVFQNHDGKLDHLSGFFLEGHSLEDTFHFGFDIFVTRDGRFHRRLRMAGGNQHHADGHALFF